MSEVRQSTHDFAAHTAQSMAANASSLNTPKLDATESEVPTETPREVARIVAVERRSQMELMSCSGLTH